MKENNKIIITRTINFALLHTNRMLGLGPIVQNEFDIKLIH